MVELQEGNPFLSKINKCKCLHFAKAHANCDYDFWKSSFIICALVQIKTIIHS